MSTSVVAVPARWETALSAGRLRSLLEGKQSMSFLKTVADARLFALGDLVSGDGFYTLFGLVLNRDLSGGHREAATYLLADDGLLRG